MSSYMLYPKKRTDAEKGKLIEFGGLQYKYLFASKLQSGEVKEYYKCVNCPARLQYFKKRGTISLTTHHATTNCRNNLDQWKRKVEKIHKFAEKSLTVNKEEAGPNCFTCESSDLSSNSMFESTVVDPKTSSEEESLIGETVDSGMETIEEETEETEEDESNIGANSFFEKTVYPEMDTIMEETDEEDGDITVILDDTDLCDPENLGNALLVSPIRPPTRSPFYLPTPRSFKSSTPSRSRSFSGKILQNGKQHNNNKNKLTFQVPSSPPQSPRTKKQVRFTDSATGEQSFVSRFLK